MPSVNVSPTPIAGTAEEDHALSRALLDQVARREIDRGVRIWAPVPALAMSRVDQLRPGADSARAAAGRAGFPAVRRVSGGHAVVLGTGSFCVGVAERSPTFEGAQERYEHLTAALTASLAELGIAAVIGELPGEWCPGAWSLRSGEIKLAGLAQRAVKGAAWTEAVVQLAPDPAAYELTAAVYDALGLPFDPRTLGSVSDVAGRDVSFEELAAPLTAN